MKFQKGHIPWNKNMKGIHLSPNSEFKRGERCNEKHHNWKGTDASYTAIHQWVARKFGKPIFCEGCGSENAKKYEWANIDKKYKREKGGWLRLCTSCHQGFDGTRNKQWKTRRSNKCT